MERTLEVEQSSLTCRTEFGLEDELRDNVIQWNKNQFYRAIGQERWKDAERYKENIERLLEE